MSPGPIPAAPAPRTPQGKSPTVGGRAEAGFLQYAQMLNPRNSMSITNTKGLLNMPGQNNCFLNSAVQVLWHLDIFRRSFRELSGHACMEDSCIFCALKELFAQFQYSQESALPPDALRRALAETFCDQRRFQLGFMDDAAECFENILMRIHFHIANTESEDMCSANHCIPHQKFAMTLVEQTVCHACGATSEPLPFTQMVHYVPSSALCSQAKLKKENRDEIPNFSELLKKAGGLGDFRDCPSSCGAVIQIRKTLMNRPEIVSIGLVWDSERPTIDHIMDVFKTIGMSLKLQDVFHSVVDSRWASTATHQLVGIVTYYGKHYSTFFFHTKLRVWIYFDDAAVREIGPKWEQVVEKCCRGHFQPLLLLYANPHGSPVNTSSAPRTVTVVPGHKKNLTGPNPHGINLSPEKNRIFQHSASNNQRRALTPNPEVTCDINANVQPRRAVTPSGELMWTDTAVTEKRNMNELPTSIKSPLRNDFGVPPYNQDYQTPCYSVKKPEEVKNSIENFSPKSNILARMSIPNYTFYDMCADQRNKNFAKSGVFNRPPSVDDILQANSTHQTSESGKQVNSPSDSQVVDQIQTVSKDPNSDNTYINRKTVENVLHLQKLQRQKSMNAKHGHVFVGQRNSSSSLESLDNVFVLRDKTLNGLLGLKLDMPESANMARRRDSGNWSGDRNSASSSSTTSLDNPHFYMVGSKRPPNCVRNIARPGVPPEAGLTDPGYDSFSLSSSDSYPSAMSNPAAKLDSRLGQIPENVQTAFVPYDLSQLQYCLKELRNNDNFPFGFKDECDKLCAEADIFIAKSVERENVGDISMAALLSDTAAAKARAAMDVPYSSTQALSMAKMKHSMCLIRSSNLHKKLKEAEVAMRRKHKEMTEVCNGNHTSPNNGSGVPQGNKESPNAPNSISSESNKIGNSQGENLKSDKNIEIYATLTKRSLKKKGALSAFVESLTGDDSSEEKNHKENCDAKKSEENCKSEGVLHKEKTSSSSLESDDKAVKSPSNKKKQRSLLKNANKDSDLSDYSSEWEQTKKPSLYRTYSGPTSNTKSDFDLNSSNQSFTDHPAKKQHKIRRKLMGGFMRRKNRSLPDLREGQDSGNEATRSFDDCFFTQTPSTCRKKMETKISPTQQPDARTISQVPQNSTDKNKAIKKPLMRAHTPPPYKPPPPIACPNPSYNVSPKKMAPHFETATKSSIPHHSAMPAGSAYNSKLDPLARQSRQHQLLFRESKNYHPKLVIPQPVYGTELPTNNAVWLKELELKQEEIKQRRKIQEERDKWHYECNPAYEQKYTQSNTLKPEMKVPSTKISENETLFLQNAHKKHEGTASELTDKEQQKSVRDLTSKFEKISVSPSSLSDEKQSPNVSSHSLDSNISSENLEDKSSKYSQQSSGLGHPPQNYFYNSQSQHTKQCDALPTSKSMILPGKDRTTTACAKTSYGLYNPQLTDAQLTNVLRIGTNRSSFRSSSSDVQDNGMRNSQDSYVFHEAKRPDKPPDYETAIQRLELLRNDRHFAKLYSSNFEALIEQEKKKRGPKKSVTFSDKVVLVACAGDEDNDFIPNPLLERVYKQHFMQKSSADETANGDGGSPTSSDNSSSSSSGHYNNGSETSKQTTFSSNRSPCHLCHKKMVEMPNLYCPDCACYMARFQQK